jgi:hypothetical protein
LPLLRKRTTSKTWRGSVFPRCQPHLVPETQAICPRNSLRGGWLRGGSLERRGVRAYDLGVRRLAGLVAILLVLSTAAPLLACMTESAMTREESACWRQMQGNCGNMAKMGCCRTEAHTDQNPQLATHAPSMDLPLAMIARLGPVLTFAYFGSHLPPRAPDEHSPPGLLTAAFTVLRI